jgi:hypothetical protein
MMETSRESAATDALVLRGILNLFTGCSLSTSSGDRGDDTDTLPEDRDPAERANFSTRMRN